MKKYRSIYFRHLKRRPYHSNQQVNLIFKKLKQWKDGFKDIGEGIMPYNVELYVKKVEKTLYFVEILKNLEGVLSIEVEI